METTVLNIQHLSSWNLCPVLLPFSPHTIATVLPGYLGILIPFIVFDIFFFMYLYSIFENNFHGDLTSALHSYHSDKLVSDRLDSLHNSSYGKIPLRYSLMSSNNSQSLEDGDR